MTRRSQLLPPFWSLLGMVLLLALSGTLLLVMNGWGGVEGAYYTQIRGPELERAYGFKLGEVPSGSDPVPRYIGFAEVSPTGVLAQCGIERGDLLADQTWIYHAVEREGFYRALSKLEEGQIITISVISPEASVGESPLRWQERARRITIRGKRS